MHLLVCSLTLQLVASHKIESSVDEVSNSLSSLYYGLGDVEKAIHFVGPLRFFGDNKPNSERYFGNGYIEDKVR